MASPGLPVTPETSSLDSKHEAATPRLRVKSFFLKTTAAAVVRRWDAGIPLWRLGCLVKLLCGCIAPILLPHGIPKHFCRAAALPCSSCWVAECPSAVTFRLSCCICTSHEMLGVAEQEELCCTPRLQHPDTRCAVELVLIQQKTFPFHKKKKKKKTNQPGLES